MVILNEKEIKFFLIFLFSYVLVISSFVYGSIFAHYPVIVNIQPVSPPLIFFSSNETGISTVLGLNKTSANVNVTLNKVLHIHDHDYNGRYVARRDYGNVRNIMQSSFSVQLDLIEIANYSYSVSNPGLVLLEVELWNGTSYRWISFYYYGGNTLNASCGNNIPFDLKKVHALNITITNFAEKNQRYSMYVDGNLVCSGSVNLKIIGNTLGIAVNVGRWELNNMYDLYIDNVRSILKGNIVNVTTEDFEDWSDNYFVNSYGVGNTGKEVIARDVYKKFLFVRVVSGRYSAYLNVSSVIGGNVSSTIWMNDTMPIVIVNNVLLRSNTSELVAGSGNVITFYMNATSRIRGSNIKVNLMFVYHINDGVTVYYPVVLVIKS